MKFEHELVYFHASEASFIEALDEKCSDGWKIIGTFSATDEGHYNSVLLQREIPPAALSIAYPKSAAA